MFNNYLFASLEILTIDKGLAIVIIKEPSIYWLKEFSVYYLKRNLVYTI